MNFQIVFLKPVFGTHVKNIFVFVESKKLQKVGSRVLANLIPPVTMADKNTKNNDNEKNKAPLVTAQGVGETANNIIKIAEKNGIPIKKDEDLVNMLSQIELNQEIPVELYKAVSEIFSFIYGISNESRQQGNSNNEKNTHI